MNPLPTPEELLGAPELALLAVLRTTLDATVATLTSVHPDLYSPDGYAVDMLVGQPLWSSHSTGCCMVMYCCN